MDPNTYFKNIAESLKSISHTEKSPAYFREFSSANILIGVSDFLTKMRNAKDTVLISQFNKDGAYFGSNSDSFAKEHTGTLYILKKCKSNGIEEARNDVYDIWQDILSKMSKDDLEGVFDTYDIKYHNSYIHSIGMVGDQYYGIAVFIPFLDFQDGSCLAYDEDRWN